MSSIVLLKDHNLGKKGTTVSVPFLVGKDLLAAGVGTYTEQSLAKPRAKAEIANPELDRLRKENDDLKRKLAESQSQVNELLAAPSPKVEKADKTDKKLIAQS